MLCRQFSTCSWWTTLWPMAVRFIGNKVNDLLCFEHRTECRTSKYEVKKTCQTKRMREKWKTRTEERKIHTTNPFRTLHTESDQMAHGIVREKRKFGFGVLHTATLLVGVHVVLCDVRKSDLASVGNSIFCPKRNQRKINNNTRKKKKRANASIHLIGLQIKYTPCSRPLKQTH